MDHDRYPYRILPRAKPVTWPGGARVALWVAVHAGWFPMDMPTKPFIAPGGMERPYPSYWDFTQRDYGHRIGIYRMMKAMAARGVKGTALLSAALVREYPVLMDDIAAAGWEPACAGLDMGHLHHGEVAGSGRTCLDHRGRQPAARALRRCGDRLAFPRPFGIGAYARPGRRRRLRLDQRLGE